MFIDLNDIEEKMLIPGFRAHTVHSESVTLVDWAVEKGAKLPEHSHPHEQITTMITGQFEMTVGGETQVLGSGSVAVIPSDTVHSGRALSDCHIIDIFHPVREDYR